jgi:hypothetical protein
MTSSGLGSRTGSPRRQPSTSASCKVGPSPKTGSVGASEVAAAGFAPKPVTNPHATAKHAPRVTPHRFELRRPRRRIGVEFGGVRRRLVRHIDRFGRPAGVVRALRDRLCPRDLWIILATPLPLAATALSLAMQVREHYAIQTAKETT